MDVELIKLKFLPLLLISTAYYLLTLLKYIINEVRNFRKELDTWDIKAYVGMTLLLSTLIIIMYTMQSGWYMQFDKVYSIDSGWCFGSIYPNAAYYDIRHPLLSIFTFPIYTIVSIANHIFVPENMWNTTTAIFIQLLNVQFIIAMGLMIKKVTDNSKEIFFLFICSYSTIMYIVFFEKYQMCIFLLVFYVYKQCKNQKIDGPLTCAAFVMPTSVFLGVSYLFMKNNWKDKVKSVIRITLNAILAMICLGRINVMISGYSEAKATASLYGGGQWLLSQKLISWFKLLQGILFPLNASAESGSYLWVNLTDRFDIFIVIIFALVLIGIIHHLKESLIITSSLWLIFSFILLVVVNWSTGESQLFSFYFAWALIPTIKYGIDVVGKKMNLKMPVVYSVIIGFMCLLDIIDIAYIGKYLSTIF